MLNVLITTDLILYQYSDKECLLFDKVDSTRIKL